MVLYVMTIPHSGNVFKALEHTRWQIAYFDLKHPIRLQKEQGFARLTLLNQPI